LEKTQILPLKTLDSSQVTHENISDWGLLQFTGHYHDQTITKEDIFHYTYAVLHNPAYRKKYELNLRREFPRLPFYNDFRKWAAWGKALMELHINYEMVEPWPLERHDFEIKAEAKRQKEAYSKVEEQEEKIARQPKVRVKLKADKSAGIIEIDELTFLSGVPAEVWEYKLGNRSAIEWVLDQYKEKKISDPTITAKFNTYRFADYKDQTIELLRRVCRVSLETVNIVKLMGNQA
jgi:predicted helicase